jgi:hypothetical protein
MDIVKRLREFESVKDYWGDWEIAKEAADEIERLREAAKDRPKDRPSEAADEIERLRKALTDLDRGINQWATTHSAIKKTLLKIIADALKENE